MSRLFALLVGMLAATLWPVIPATGAGALTASLDLVHGYTYDVHPGSATATFTTSGLGAPATYVPALARHAVDDESHGPLAGPTTNGAIGYTTYDPDVPLVQDASGSGTTQAAFGSHEEESAALRDAIVAAKTPGLNSLASEIREAGLHPAARNNRTIAVGIDADGGLFAGSSNGFDAGQRAALARLGITRVPGSGALHAEEELLRGVPTLQRVGTSVRAPCGASEHNCALQLIERGVGVE